MNQTIQQLIQQLQDTITTFQSSDGSTRESVDTVAAVKIIIQILGDLNA
jgi:hypothetical protein